MTDDGHEAQARWELLNHEQLQRELAEERRQLADIVILCMRLSRAAAERALATCARLTMEDDRIAMSDACEAALGEIVAAIEVAESIMEEIEQ